MMSSESGQSNKENELIISLLGRIAFRNDDLKRMVTRGSKKPDETPRVYNLCDGTTTVSDIAKKARVEQSTVSRAVDRWEEQGIMLKKSQEQ